MRVGIITFHGSHNYGSVLQAYATQKIVAELGYEAEIINFRMESQKRYYSLYPHGYGIWLLGQCLLMLPIHNKRAIRAKKFESFIEKMNLSGSELKNRDDLKTIIKRYDVYLSGSDQIWSLEVPELVGAKEDFTGVYFFDFIDNDKPRISYASSIGKITYKELISKKDLLKKFNSLSTREQYGVDLLKRIVKRNVELVLDPTFLLNKEQWWDLAGENRLIKEPYVFLYTLHGLKHGLKWGRVLTEFKKRIGLNIVAVSPFFPITAPAVHNVIDAGPLDFLNLIKNAELIFTDSFHGTAFSINMNKPFYSYLGKDTGDTRKLGLMKMFGIEERALESINDIDRIDNYGLDYKKYKTIIDCKREKSKMWLINSLEALK